MSKKDRLESEKSQLAERQLELVFALEMTLAHECQIIDFPVRLKKKSEDPLKRILEYADTLHI